MKFRPSHAERGPTCRLLEEADVKVSTVAEAVLIGAKCHA